MAFNQGAFFPEFIRKIEVTLGHRQEMGKFRRPMRMMMMFASFRKLLCIISVDEKNPNRGPQREIRGCGCTVCSFVLYGATQWVCCCKGVTNVSYQGLTSCG